jgi:hypothetical protein
MSKPVEERAKDRDSSTNGDRPSRARKTAPTSQLEGGGEEEPAAGIVEHVRRDRTAALADESLVPDDPPELPGPDLVLGNLLDDDPARGRDRVPWPRPFATPGPGRPGIRDRGTW